jgi:hypothetical protein
MIALIRNGTDFELVGLPHEGELRLLNYLCDGQNEVAIGERISVNGEPLDDIDELGLRSLYHCQ